MLRNPSRNSSALAVGRFKYSYLFYIEGLDKEVTINASTEKLARKQLWDSLDSSEQDAVVQVECLDVTDLEI